MKCILCNVIVKNLSVTKFVPEDILLCAHIHNIPFFCKHCGAIKFPYRATRDVVFLWPDPLPKRYNESIIEIPGNYKEFYNNSFGTLISIGPGYCDKKKFYPVSKELKVGIRVLYDRTVPWSTDVVGNDGKKHDVKIMGEKDIKCIVEDQ